MAIELETNTSSNPKSFTFESAIFWKLKILGHIAKYIGIPIAFKNEKVYVDLSLGKRFFWFSTLSILLLRTIVVVGALSLSFTVDRFSNPLFTPLYLATASGCGIALVSGFLGMTRHIADFVIIWNSILKYQTQVKPPQLVVLVLHLFPPSMYITGWMVNIFLALNPDWMIQFRFGVTWALAEGHLSEGWWGYHVLVATVTFVDIWSMFAMVGIVSVTVPLHMFFMETWPRVTKELIKSSKKYTSSIFRANLVWKQIQELLVMLQIFNVGNAFAVFAIKLAFLVTSICCGSAMILMQFHHNFPLLIIMSYLTISAPFSYPALYYNAYSVSEGLQRAKLELLGIPKTKVGLALFERRLRSVSTKGIWMGSFRTFERESILIFFDFVIRTIVSIVLASSN